MAALLWYDIKSLLPSLLYCLKNVASYNLNYEKIQGFCKLIMYTVKLFLKKAENLIMNSLLPIARVFETASLATKKMDVLFPLYLFNEILRNSLIDISIYNAFKVLRMFMKYI